ncbi:DNA-processing protein DprA [Mesomycoplasma moatsii]|uniref:DNA-processing protein DprA n=1 Tax=Mesomycoplasma moatsii TaxID=171287 RepID=UPI0003B5B154
MDLILIYFAIKYKGYFHEIYQAIKNKEYVSIEDLEKVKTKIDNQEIQAITIIDDDYPESLKLINNPPFVLFYKGNKKLLKEDILLLTGDFLNEKISKFLYESMNEISKNHTLISNFSKGLDEEIVDYFIEQNKKIILISANGLQDPYFAKKLDFLNINKNILILSEYPEGVNLNKKRLIQRNRISMGLSKALIIASSNKQSKVLSLVSFALEQGKDVFCFPGLQDDNDGNNLLIQDGATMITSIKNRI